MDWSNDKDGQVLWSKKGLTSIHKSKVSLTKFALSFPTGCFGWDWGLNYVSSLEFSYLLYGKGKCAAVRMKCMPSWLSIYVYSRSATQRKESFISNDFVMVARQNVLATIQYILVSTRK